MTTPEDRDDSKIVAPRAAGGRTTHSGAYPPRVAVRRIGEIREEPYFASPVFACPSCGYLTTVGLPECPRCFASLPQPPSGMRFAVRAVQWLVAIGGLGYALGLPWWVAALALALTIGREIRRPRPPRHPAQFGER